MSTPLLFADFEFTQPAGEIPRPICLSACSDANGWQDVWLQPGQPCPLPSGPYVLVAYLASAELGCMQALGWPEPWGVIDLYVEFKRLYNGRKPLNGYGLLGALQHYGIKGISDVDKAEYRNLAIRGGPFTTDEQKALQDYCRSDVEALLQLWQAMQADIGDMQQALWRGEYMKAVAAMECRGIPIDTASHEAIMANWQAIRADIVAEVNAEYGCFKGLSFNEALFADYLKAQQIQWPTLPSGRLRLDQDTFKDKARSFPQLETLRQARDALANMRKASIAIGHDGRNRCMLSPYSSKTGRNQPSSTAFIFGNASWRRFLVQAGPGMAILKIDYEQQEFGIAAALSQDRAMMEAYLSGDPYLAFAKQAGAIPADGTKEAFKVIRDQYKQAALAVQYGMGAKSLAAALGLSVYRAQRLIDAHRATYTRFWAFVEAAILVAHERGYMETRAGWRFYCRDAGVRTLQNWPIQATGGDILRLACIELHRAGFALCAPIHDALAIEISASGAEELAAQAQAIMEQASRDVLGGFTIRTEAEIFAYPGRYVDKRGAAFWELVQGKLAKLQEEAA
jgi:hypothetical protein